MYEVYWHSLNSEPALLVLHPVYIHRALECETLAKDEEEWHRKQDLVLQQVQDHWGLLPKEVGPPNLHF